MAAPIGLAHRNPPPNRFSRPNRLAPRRRALAGGTNPNVNGITLPLLGQRQLLDLSPLSTDMRQSHQPATKRKLRNQDPMGKKFC